MGLLEDAIREHLELKRRHGAPDQELERQEVEALGPARREMPSPEQAGGEEGAIADEVPAALEADDHGIPLAEDQEPAAEVSDLDPAAGAPEPGLSERGDTGAAPPEELELEQPEAGREPQGAPGRETAYEPQEREPAFEDEPAIAYEPHEREPAFEGEPAFEDEPVPRGDTPPRGSEPVEPERQGAEDEDVLEHTPEFLQETPEHDRLWFEQKPPRDFDFD